MTEQNKKSLLLEQLFENNRSWAASMVAQDADFF